MNKSTVDHALVGTWISEDEDTDTAFVVSAAGDAFHVSGFSRSSAIPFEIFDLTWDGEALSFRARFPPSNTITKNVLRARPDGAANLELTLHEVWMKKDVKPGETPEAWRMR